MSSTFLKACSIRSSDAILTQHLFARAYYVNLDRRTDRREYMEAMLKRQCIPATRFAACTPATPEVAKLLEVDAHEDLRLLPGMTASGISHLHLWRICASQPPGDDAAMLVLEDDVMLLQRWRAELAQCLRKAPIDWELLYLDAWPGSCCWHFPFGCARKPAELLLADDCRFTSAYLIRPSAARWLIARQTEAPHLRHESLLIELQQRGRSWHTLPKLALQLWDDVSDIASDAVSVATRNFYRDTYFPVFPRALYDAGVTHYEAVAKKLTPAFTPSHYS